jgi:hypothetical protein
MQQANDGRHFRNRVEQPTGQKTTPHGGRLFKKCTVALIGRLIEIRKTPAD